MNLTEFSFLKMICEKILAEVELISIDLDIAFKRLYKLGFYDFSDRVATLFVKLINWLNSNNYPAQNKPRENLEFVIVDNPTVCPKILTNAKVFYELQKCLSYGHELQKCLSYGHRLQKCVNSSEKEKEIEKISSMIIHDVHMMMKELCENC